MTVLMHLVKLAALALIMWQGFLCHIEDPCVPNPCRPGSECEPGTLTGKYTCTCPKGYAGKDCYEDINECNMSEEVCYNGGTCVNTAGSWYCDCAPGFTDPWCMTRLGNQCAPNPCQNSGTCIDYGTRYQCVCMSGFHGTNCELMCPAGYEGEHCERHQSKECNSTQCQNGGVCLKGLCRCPPGYAGEHCEKSESCKFHNCPQNAVCVPLNDGANYRCECKLGYYGHNCELEMNKCSSNPCQHGGVCTDHVNGYICSCATGYSGENCQINIDDCSTNPCLNEGICIDDINSYICHCKMPYDGDRCQIKLDPCETNRCENGAECRPDASYRNYTCDCPEGFEGHHCEKDIDECKDSRRCLNGGACVNSHGSYHCRCVEGFIGRNCEADHDNCLSNPCQNGGRCVDEVNGYHCECPAGFTGPQCATNIDNCASSPCENGASCIDRINGFECFCRQGFSGALCNINDDDCKPGLCLNGGTCMDGVNSYRCRCQRGFTGENCQIAVDMEQFNITDLFEQQLCIKNDCANKAGNQICDQACNYYVCGYDGGDCSARTNPFQKCDSPSYCAHVFRDGKCDPACNNENCLFDGFDCDGTSERCVDAAFCEKHYNDGKCDSICDNADCGWDGGDCSNNSADATLRGNIILVLLVSPEDFIQNAQTFLITLSQKLRGSVRVRMMDGKPMIYSWSLSNGVGLLYNISASRLHLLTANHELLKRQVELRGTMLVLTLDVSRCKHDDREECFTDLFSVVEYLGAANAKQELQETGMPMYSARAEVIEEPIPEQSSAWKTVVICGVGIVIVLLVYTVIQQGQKRKVIHATTWHPPPPKRKVIHATTWHPPPPESCKSSCKSLLGNLDTHSLYNDCLFNSFSSTRRNVRQDTAHPNLYIGEETQLFLKPKYSPDGRQWSLIHEQADSTAPIPTPIDEASANKRGKHGRTALMQTASNQAKDEQNSIIDVENLLKAGAEINAQDDFDDTALMLAVKSGRTAVVEYLLKNGADPTIVDEMGRTPLHHAVAVNMPDIVKQLLATNCINVNAIDDENRTALMVCSKYDIRMGTEMVDILVKAKADVSCAGDKRSMNYDGKTALHFAAQHGNIEIIRFLIRNGANKDAQDALDQTPLFLAASEGHAEAVECLINSGASKEITDQKGRSPRDVAAEKEFHEIVRYLDSVPVQRLLPTLISNSMGSCAQQHCKKKRIMLPISKKALTDGCHPVISTQLASNHPLTPPLSAGSNFSVTPSPDDPSQRVVLRGLIQWMNHTDTSSVMLSPYSDYHNGNVCSPPQGISSMMTNNVWVPLDSTISYGYRNGFAQSTLVPYLLQYVPHPVKQQIPHYCGV